MSSKNKIVHLLLSLFSLTNDALCVKRQNKYCEILYMAKMLSSIVICFV